MFFWRINPFWKKAKILFLLLFVSQIFFVSLITFTHRYFVPFVPLMVLFAVQGFFTIADGALARIQASGIRECSLSWFDLYDRPDGSRPFTIFRLNGPPSLIQRMLPLVF